MKHAILIAAGAVLVATGCSRLTPTPDQLYSDAVAAHRAGHDRAALSLFTRAAEADHLDAQLNLVRYYQGADFSPHAAGDRVRPHERNERLAGAWSKRYVGNLKARAAAGEAEAQQQLGTVYFQGGFIGPDGPIDQDRGEALRLWQAAAEQGFAPAFHALGLYDYMVQQDYAAARRDFETAVSLGECRSGTGLARLYLYGQGGPQDVVRAIRLLKQMTGVCDDSQAQKTLAVTLAGITRAAEDGNEQSQQYLEELRAAEVM